MNDTRVQTKAQGFRLIPETATFLDLCVAACCGIISRQTRNLLKKAYFLTVALVLTLLVGTSRIYLGVHFPSDVLAGWAVGSLWSTMCTQIARWLQREGKVEAPEGNVSA